MLNKTIMTAAVATALVAGMGATQAQALEVSGHVALTTDYKFRGISQSDESAAIQGGFDVAFEPGFYIGTWGSSVDFDCNDIDIPDGHPEVDGACSGLDGSLELDGRLPSNPSGGLASKGHPVGATGCGMIYEIVTQLRGEAGGRQVPRNPKTGMTLNGGGILGIDAASLALHVFKT